MRFEVLLNGEKLCVAGVGEGDLRLRVTSSWPASGSEARKDIEWTDQHGPSLVASGQPALDVVGLDSEFVDERAFWVWLQQKLQMGDEVTVRIVGNGATTPPKGRLRLGSGPYRRAASAFGSA